MIERPLDEEDLKEDLKFEKTFGIVGWIAYILGLLLLFGTFEWIQAVAIGLAFLGGDLIDTARFTRIIKNILRIN